VDTVIRALPRVLQTVPDAVYVVAGDGPDADYLEALARAEGVDDHVIFAGRLSWEHLRACYTAAQVFALPARQADPDVEGFGIVFLEANACETPVIGARTGGIPDAIADGQSGLLVPPDHPEALAEALVRLLSDPERASEMGRQGRRRVLDGFTWSHAAERIARILTSMKYFLLIPFLVLTACSSPDGGSAPSSSADSTESPFVALSTVAPGVIYDLRYLTNENFLGRPVAGYIDPVCLLTPEAAAGLARAQALAEARGLTLQVFDCYRPQTAVNDFVAWAADPADTLMQSAYYPRVPKDSLFAQGYIAERSGHSRGSTVDLALARDGVLLDFGTPYDYFDVVSHTADSTISAEARANRDLLVDIMGEAGFTNYAAEWWHYTLRSEPYDGTYFDLPVISPM
jgi:D-alanyl-D-alanine dipeptidase